MVATYDGLNSDFAVRLRALVAASGGRITLASGYRSVAQQTALWNAALAKYGSAQAARMWVAPPGASNHNRGLAMDLAGDLNLAAQLAPRFGLTHPLANEPWHFEPVGLRAHPNTDPRAYTPNGGMGGGFDDQLDRFMGGVRQRESSGNYAERPNRVGASGAYGFLPGTWGNYKGYAQAYLAPPAVQDEKARQLMSGYFQRFGSWGKVAEAWLGGPNNVGKNLSDGAVTQSKYARQVLALAGLDGSATVGPAPVGGPPADADRHDPGVQLQSFLDIISNPASMPAEEVTV